MTRAVAAPSFSNSVQPFITKNCVLCHNTQAKVGGLDLSIYHSEADAMKDRELWERVELRVKNHEMPPKGRPAPAPAEIAKVTEWIDGATARLDKNMKPDPGRVTASRLNRAEYSNTIRDLLAVNFRATDVFPPDDSGYGFDNIGDVLSLSPVLMEKYLSAAEKISKRAIPSGVPLKPVMNRAQAESFGHGEDRVDRSKFDFPVEADYDIRTQYHRRP